MSSHFTDPGYLIAVALGLAFWLIEQILSRLPVGAREQVVEMRDSMVRPIGTGGALGAGGFVLTGDPVATALLVGAGLLFGARDRKPAPKKANA